MINAASSLVVLGAGHDDTVATPLYSCTRPRPPLRPSQPAPPTPASTASPTPTPNPQPQALPKPKPPPRARAADGAHVQLHARAAAGDAAARAARRARSGAGARLYAAVDPPQGHVQDAGGLQPDLLAVRVRCRLRHVQRRRLGREQDRMRGHVRAKQVQEGAGTCAIDALGTTRQHHDCTRARARLTHVGSTTTP